MGHVDPPGLGCGVGEELSPTLLEVEVEGLATGRVDARSSSEGISEPVLDPLADAILAQAARAGLIRNYG